MPAPHTTTALIDQIDPFLRDDIDENELEATLDRCVRDRAFELAAAFICRLLLCLKGTYHGAVIVHWLGIDRENDKITELAADYGISKTIVFRARKALDQILAGSDFAKYKIRRRPAEHKLPGHYSLRQIEKKFGIERRVAVRAASDAGIVPDKHGKTLFYPMADIDRLYAEGKFERQAR